MANIRDVSAITERIKARVTQIEEQLKQHQNLLTSSSACAAHLPASKARSAHASPRAAAAANGGAPQHPGPQPNARARLRQGPPANPSAPLRAHHAGRTRPRSSRRSRTARRPRQNPKQTGIGPGTVSTTLNKMAKAGEIAKAERGYALPQ